MALAVLVSAAALKTAVSVLGFVATNAASGIADAVSQELLRRLVSDRECRRQYEAAWCATVAELNAADACSDEDAAAIGDNLWLIHEEAAKLVLFGNSPEVDGIMRRMWSVPRDRFPALRPVLEQLLSRMELHLRDQPMFREALLAKDVFAAGGQLHELAAAATVTAEQLALLTQAALDPTVGILVRPATAPPKPVQVQSYIAELASRPPTDILGRPLGRFAPPRLGPVDQASAGATRSSRDGEPAGDVLERVGSFVLVSDPGGGKTQCIHHLTQSLAVEAICGDRTVPLRASLRYYGEVGLLGLVAAEVDRVSWARSGYSLGGQQPPDAWLRAWLAAGDCSFVYLLDGLDEVPPQWRAAAVDELRALAQGRYPVLVSCRQAEYRGEMGALPCYRL
ncbi:MAG: hypothetical protein ACYC5O_20060, partial [Anaerolineae bacterium]